MDNSSETSSAKIKQDLSNMLMQAKGMNTQLRHVTASYVKKKKMKREKES